MNLDNEEEIIKELNPILQTLSAEKRIEWALDHFGSSVVMTSSFGIQSAVLLHLVTTLQPDIPVIFIDTGYLFPETYAYCDQLTNLLNLDIRVVRSEISPAWQESRFGKLFWENGKEGIIRYNNLNKLIPFQTALSELFVNAWFSGLRRHVNKRTQLKSRSELQFIVLNRGRFNIHPILDWSEKAIQLYMETNSLPVHPLAKEGYLSVGDWHSTSLPLVTDEGMEEEEDYQI